MKARGVYSLLELADRVRRGQPLLAIEEKPATGIRSMMKSFTSDVEDKPWYNDRAMWPEYLTMLATNRFNRFNLAFGIGYDFTREIRDCYLHFAYPFLLDVPGYKVRAKGLPDAERDRNLEMLKFISDETAKRGMRFQLGIWTHAYEWTDSPEANYTFEGLNAANHASYCRDALHQLLMACPNIGGVTFESMVKANCSRRKLRLLENSLLRHREGTPGRKIEIDMHAKGMDDGGGMIKGYGAPRPPSGIYTARAPLLISPKYIAEHMGLPAYHQAGIHIAKRRCRRRINKDSGFFSKSNGSRSFMRYGYGDLLAEGRKYGVLPSDVARHPANAGLGRSRFRGCLCTRSWLLRQRRHSELFGAPFLQGPQRLRRLTGQFPRLGYADKSLEPEVGLAEVRSHLPCLGPATLPTRHADGRRRGSSASQPHPAPHHASAWTFRGQQ